MKSFLLLAAVGLALASCEKNEPLTQRQRVDAATLEQAAPRSLIKVVVRHPIFRDQRPEVFVVCGRDRGLPVLANITLANGCFGLNAPTDFTRFVKYYQVEAVVPSSAKEAYADLALENIGYTTGIDNWERESKRTN